MASRDELYEALSLAEENDQLATARVLYEEILQDDPENGALQILHAANLIELGDLATAEEVLGSAGDLLEEDEIRPGYLVQRGNLARERGALEEAEAHFREAHKLNKEDGDPLILAASVASARGELAKAEYLVREAAKLPETAEEGYFQLGNILVSQQRYEEAYETFSKVLELAPGNELAEEWQEDLAQVLELKEE